MNDQQIKEYIEAMSSAIYDDAGEAGNLINGIEFDSPADKNETTITVTLQGDRQIRATAKGSIADGALMASLCANVSMSIRDAAGRLYT